MRKKKLKTELRHKRLDKLRGELMAIFEDRKGGLKPNELRALAVTSDRRPKYPHCFSQALVRNGLMNHGLNPNIRAYGFRPGEPHRLTQKIFIEIGRKAEAGRIKTGMGYELQVHDMMKQYGLTDGSPFGVADIVKEGEGNYWELDC